MPLLPRDTELPLLAKRPLTFAGRHKLALLILLVGAVLDALTTYANVRDFGPHVETHPVQRLVFQLLGPQAGVPVAKFIQLAFVLFVAAWWRPWTTILLALCGILYTAAALSNHFQLL